MRERQLFIREEISYYMPSKDSMNRMFVDSNSKKSYHSFRIWKKRGERGMILKAINKLSWTNSKSYDHHGSFYFMFLNLLINSIINFGKIHNWYKNVTKSIAYCSGVFFLQFILKKCRIIVSSPRNVFVFDINVS